MKVLSLRVLFPLVLLLALLIVFAGALNELRSQRKALQAEVAARAQQTALHLALLAEQEGARYPELLKTRFALQSLDAWLLLALQVHPDGQIVQSSDPILLGKPFKDLPELAAHWPRENETDMRSRQISLAGGEQFLLLMPYRVEAGGSELRSAERGWIVLWYDLAPARNQLWENTLDERLPEAGLLAAVLLLLLLLLQRLLIAPLQALARVAESLRAGQPVSLPEGAHLAELQAVMAGIARLSEHLAEENRLRQLRDRELQAAAADQNAILQAIPDLLFVIDDKGIYQSLHALRPELLYRPEQEVLGRHVAEILPTEAATSALQVIDDALRNGYAGGRQIMLVLQGQECWFELSAARIAAGDGQPQRCVVLSRDVTRRKRNELLLREQSELHLAVVATSLDGFWLFDMQGKLLEVNDSYCRLSGYEREELLGRHISEFDLNENVLAVGAHIGVIAELGRDRYLTKHRTRHGQVRDIEVSIAYLPQQGGCFCAFLRDVTDRQQQELANRLWIKVLAQCNDGVMVTDSALSIVLVNPAFTRITGFASDEVLGQRPSVLASHQHDPHFYRKMWQSIQESGNWQGEIWNRHRDGHVYPEWLSISVVRNDGGDITHYIGIFNDISREKADQERIRLLAHYDELTGLPNRSLLFEQAKHLLYQAERSGQHLALLFLDLDHFKHINDTLGHRVGDELLVAVALRLKASTRDVDLTSRLGGDEFILLLPDTDAEGAGVLADKLVKRLSDPYHLEGHALQSTPSIGVAIFPDDGSDFDSLSKCADMAMYRAKAGGRQGFCFYTPEMQHKALRRMALEQGLREAVAAADFRLVYQPQVQLDSGQVGAVEALLRWLHPELGEIEPEEFIPLAEENGLIMQLGDWVLHTAASQMVRWLQAGMPPMVLCVNLSAVQFRQRDLAQRLARVLGETGLPGHCLELELTEALIVEEPEQAAAIMHELKALGVRLAIDDFGTGYSSLERLRRFPLDRLKIDSRFVHELQAGREDAAIVSAIIGLGHALGFAAVAEGVETPAQLQLLRAQDCDAAQGNQLCPPLPAAELGAWLEQRGGSVLLHSAP
ncbi:sensor domain-containing protein [Chitinilyticum litopenaei]|uniref:sensor domain-containing protein n=1 Tax=Chitinilyticum litopenaei TaxID=1121276 RepID=UPI000400A526|nr:EAL domain-containing protein [Chitinilyticum litopenaei]